MSRHDTTILLSLLAPFILLAAAIAAWELYKRVRTWLVWREFKRRRAARSPEEVQADLEEVMGRGVTGFMAAWRAGELEVQRRQPKEGQDQ